MAGFEPSATLARLKQRAQLMQSLRAFFSRKDVWEVDPPVLGAHTVTDVHIEPVVAYLGQQRCFLQTSPEYYMKRLLAAGSGSIFYLGSAFRQDEQGHRHRAEFTMLEWYREGFDDRQLMAEMTELLLELGVPKVTQQQYGALFQQTLGVCPYRADAAQLRALARQRLAIAFELPNKSDWLDLLFSHCIEPALQDEAVLVYDYPLEQCALARTQETASGVTVARRFELFWQGMELANGYYELSDPRQQQRRFEQDRAIRRDTARPVPEADYRLLAALEHGLPDCAGVALGVDRLLMCLTGATDIAQVMPFADH